ncbi:MAG: PAS domain-containing sensor histidine kinase [Bacteroidales bacterium]|jgi:nitrogen-specific signal transduction histidine kinase|nr:PAS domain-containing sensor histidine kinase [Bacteroidales bacterium]
MISYHANQERSSKEAVKKQNESILYLGYAQQLMDAMPCPGAILNGNRQVVYANKALLNLIGSEAAEGVLGMQPGEIVGCEHAWKMPDGCGTAIECRYCGAVNVILKVQETQKPETGECLITTVNGGKRTSFEFEITCTPFVVKEGETFIIMALTDISSKKRKEMLEQAFLHNMDDVTGNLQGLSKLFKRTDEEGKLGKLVDILALVSEAVNEEISSYRQLLGAESDNLSLNMEDVTAYDTIFNVVRFVESCAHLNNRQVVMKPPFPNVSFKTDPALLQRILFNMLKNALEASSLQPVSIGYTADDDRLSFWVQNQTVMPENVKARIFQRSFSTKGSSRGLGTYSMKLLAEHYLKGEVNFESTEEKGTLFRVILPLTPPEKVPS